MDKQTKQFIDRMLKKMSLEKIALMFWIHRSTLQWYIDGKPITPKTLRKMKSNADIWNQENLDALTDWVK